MVLAIARSLNSRKQLELELGHFKSTLDATVDMVFMCDEERQRFIYANRGAVKQLGYPMQELLAMPPQQLAGEEDGLEERLQQLCRGEQESVRYEGTLRRKNGDTLPVEVQLQHVQLPSAAGRFVMVARDISERKQAERELARANRALRTLSSCNTVLIHARDEQQLLEDVCTAIVEQGGYRLTWVGFAGEEGGVRRVQPVAGAGFQQEYLSKIHVNWDDSPLGNGPVGRAIRYAEASVIQDVHTDPRFEPWRDAALQRGYSSVVGLPLLLEGQVIGALSIYASEVNAFGEEELRLLEELAADLSFGIATLRTRSEHDRLRALQVQSEQRLHDTLIETIKAMAMALEKRDPYTAGHQQRVSELALALAKQMGLSAAQCEGIGFGALIHDIGKIYIPAEILNRPGKLTENEFSLIKSHPRVGYEILEAVPFPWPVAQMVLQHHERLDGSGYPDGLKGEEILLEARVLAVADVVEAITSHRPYRPGLGIEVAVAELRKYRGSWYDPEVVDACLQLLEEKGWDWPDS
jgi:PAS domain S-box-containing protein/putative nucleotidyltransferase with HDIG domain